MNSVFIPFHGIGEVYIDVFDLRWRMLSSSFYNFRKNIPFFKLLLDMGSLMMRCYIRFDARETDAYNIILYNHYIKVFDQYVRNGKRNFHDCCEMNFTSVNLKDELINFRFI